MRAHRARLPFPVLALVAFIALAAAIALATAVAGSADARLSGYWNLPLAPQGDAPAAWSDPERALAPEACGQCHAEKLAEWRTSLHARAFSPGLVGQLLTYDPAQTAACMECHAPLAEQRDAFEQARRRGNAHLPAGQGLAAAGNSCAGCHLRGHRRHGPPQRVTGTAGQSDEAGPHGGVYRTAYFEDSAFCSACHQFPQESAINGKPLQNTFAEWQASPQAARGIACQGCHMPDRRHLWRGIHDPDMVTSGLTADVRQTADGIRFALTNSGVGHAFPTYVTPRVEMRAVALDGDGRPVPETAVRHVIQRVVAWTGEAWTERSDTRLLPGETATLLFRWQGYGRARVWLEVWPDDYYDRQVYDGLLTGMDAGSIPAQLIAEADRAARTSNYSLFVTEATKP
jgi:hypothetical protein